MINIKVMILRLTSSLDEMQTMRVRTSYLVLSIMLLLYLLWCCTSFKSTSPTTRFINNCYPPDIRKILKRKECMYDNKYPLTDPLRVGDGDQYKIAIVADLDEDRSRVAGKKNTWQSYLKTGYFTKLFDGSFRVEWTEQTILTSTINEKGRGLELSELCVYNGKLLTVDDRTGIVYEILNGEVIPWVILMDGDGRKQKGFKGEWMTVKDKVLFVGGLGKEWTTKAGTFINYHPLFVKAINQFGAVTHMNWTTNYLDIRAKVGIHFPGYMIHEAVMWSEVRKRWYFLPRRMSKQMYDDMADERRGTNVLISCDENFTDMKVVYVGNLDPTHGFSSFKFVPGTGEELAVALKSREVEGNISTYIMVFNVLTGVVLMTEKFVAYDKYEGIEFV